jgi:hypothetical protein
MPARARPPAIVLAAASAAAVAAALAGCGDREPAAKPAAPVWIEVTSPGDRFVTRDEVVEVRGRVRPARADVTVLGVPAAVRGGEFSARVALSEGPNVLDVAASARGAAPALAALRVTREVRVTVPDLIGEPADDAADRLEELGLQPEEERDGGLFDALLPGEYRVCDTDPRGGAEVQSGARVLVLVAKDC